MGRLLEAFRSAGVLSVGAVVVGAMGVLHACTVDLSLPQDAIVTCSTAADCPSGLVCRVELGRCVSKSNTDFSAPAFVVAPSIVPSRVSRQAGFDHFDVHFTLDEDVGLEAPGLAVSIEGRWLSCVHAAAVYTCEHDVDAQDREGSREVVVVVRDAHGNAAERRATVAFDFTAPQALPESQGVALASGSPWLFRVARAGPGAIVSASFAVDESLGEDPVVSATGPDSLPFTLLSSFGTAYVYEHTVSIAASGTYEVGVTLTDVVGNRRTVPLDLQFIVDCDSPAPPDVDTAERVVYAREPWGSSASGGVARYALLGQAGALEGGALAVAFDGPSADTASEVGRIVVGPDGSFGLSQVFELSRSDRLSIYLGALDAAGNLSPLRRVRDIEWTATMGGKQPGSTFENPHRFEARTIAMPRFDQADAAELSDYASLRVDGETVTPGSVATTGGGSWARVGLGGAPPSSRYGHGLTFDSVRGRLVLHGGRLAGGGASGETWEWNGQRWQLAAAADPEGDGGPGARYDVALAFDARRERTVLFGGYSTSGQRDTWEWDGVSWRLRAPRDPEGDGQPRARYRHALAYDSDRGETLMFGGVYSSTDADWMWAWDGNSWASHPPTGSNLPPHVYLENHAMAYDAGRHQVVMYGGCSNMCGVPSGGCYAHTWLWDTLTRAWVDVAGAAEPGILCGHRMTYDPVRARVVMSGGMNDLLVLSSATWEWAGDHWILMTPTDPETDGMPSAAAFQGLVFDPADSTTLHVNAMSNQIWRWNGLSWALWRGQDPEADGNPSARYAHAGTYSVVDGALLTLGGVSVFGRTWGYDGWSWRTTDAAFPTTADDLRYPAMAYDAARGAPIVFGGQGRYGSADTWGLQDQLWERTAGGWAKRCGTGTACSGPGARMATAIAPAPTLSGTTPSGVLLFGGCNTAGCNGAPSNETWRWDGAAWHLETPATSPAGRYFHALAYDAARNEVVMFGGRTAASAVAETWLWSGADWRLAAPTDPEHDGNPPALTSHALAYDTQRQVVMLYGGFGDSGQQGDLWQWDGSSWRRWTAGDLEGDGSPSARNSHVLAYDSLRDSLVLFGGFDADASDETWEWTPAPGRRPGHVFKVAFAAAGVDGDAIRSLRARWVASGRGFDGASLHQGSRLLVWDENGWVPVVTNGAALDSPASLDWTTGDAEQVVRMLTGPQLYLAFAAEPVAGNGATPAVIQSDYVEVKVRYRLP